jgi:defect in organelle trafficking protein DotC
VITRKQALIPTALHTLLALALAAACVGANAQDQGGVERIMSTVKAAPGDADGLSVVREEALRDAAATMGARLGLREKSCAIRAEIEAQRVRLDKKFRFSDMMMGRGVLPPTISEARDSVALDATVMRVASRVYHLDEPARVVDLPPT